MQPNFTDNNKINKHNFFKNNICSQLFNDYHLTCYWELKEIPENYYYIGRTDFNWDNKFCDECKIEYGCINIIYNKDKKIKSPRPNLNNRKPELPDKKLQEFKKDYCIGCFMAKHNKTFSGEDMRHSNRRKQIRIEQEVEFAQKKNLLYIVNGMKKL
jgi:hypothetical protein